MFSVLNPPKSENTIAGVNSNQAKKTISRHMPKFIHVSLENHGRTPQGRFRVWELNLGEPQTTLKERMFFFSVLPTKVMLGSSDYV